MKTKIFTFFVAWAVAGMTTAQVQSVMTGINVKDIQIKSIDVENTIDREKFTAESYANRFAKKANAANANYGGIDYYSVDGMMHAGITIVGDMYCPVLLLPYQDVTVWKNRIMPMATASWTITEAPTTWNINGQTVENSQTCETLYDPLFFSNLYLPPVTNDHTVLLNDANLEIMGYQYGASEANKFVCCAPVPGQFVEGGNLPMTLCGMYCDPSLNDGDSRDWYIVGAGSYGDYSIGTGLNIEGKSIDTIGSIVRNVSPMKVEQLDIVVCDKTNQGGAYMFPEGASIKVEIFAADLTAGLIDTTEPLYTTTMTIADYTEFNAQLGMISAKFYEEDIFGTLSQEPIVLEGDFYVQFTNFNESGCKFGFMSDYTTPGGTTLYTWDGEFTTLWSDGGANMLINYDAYWPTIMYDGGSDVLVAPVEGGYAMDVTESGEYAAVALYSTVLDFENWGEVEAPEWIEVVLDESVLSTDGYVIASFEVAPLPEGETGRQGIVTVDADGFKLDIVINQGDVPTTPTPIGITYELNGGVTNDYGWMSKGDMFTACITDALGYDLGMTLDEFKRSNTPFDDLFVFFNVDHCQNILDNSRWDWLEDYLVMIQEESVAATLTKGYATVDWCYAIAAFFFEGQYSTSSDYSQFGKYEEYILAWKHAYDNPTSPKKEWTLNAPYKEGATFEGWYTTADFTGEQVTTVNASTTGTLYAKWNEESTIDPSHQILYTTTDEQIISIDSTTTAFGANFISNTYEKGQGVISFDGPVTSIGEHAFYECTTLSSITLPEGVRHIGDWAFDGCISLTALTIPSTVESFGGWEFIARSGVNTIVWKPKNFNNTMGDSPFNNGSEQITSFIFEEGVERIPNHICTGMPLLISVVIPESVTHIGDWAFWGCTSLSSIISNAITPPVLEGNDVFSDVPYPLTLNIPCVSLKAYQQSNWAKYCNIIDDCEYVSRTEEAICYGDSYLWEVDGNWYEEEGTYYATNEEGEHVLELIVYPPTEDTEEYASIPMGSTYWWNEMEYTEAGTYTETLFDENGCEYTATLHLTLVEAEEVSRTEEAICYGDSYFWDIDGNWYEESGTYYAYDEEGKHVLVLTVYPPAEDTEEYATIVPGETYWWNDWEYTEAGTYTETLIDENGCEYTATLYLTEEDIDACAAYMCNNREFTPQDDCLWYALDLAELSNGEDLRIVITNEWGGEYAQCDMTFYVERDETAASIFEIYETIQHGQTLDTIVPRSLFEQYEKLYLQISVDASLNILFTYYTPCTSENSIPYIWGTEVSTDGEDAGIYHIDLEQLRRENQNVELSITNSSYDNGFFWMLNYGDNCSQNQCGDDPNLSIGMITKPTANSTEKWILDLAQANETSTDYYFQATLFNDAGLDEELLSGNWVMNPVKSRTTLCQNAESIKSGWIYQLQADEQRYYQLDSADICTADALRPVFLTIENLSDSPTECTYSTGICGMEQIMPTITLSAHESKIVPVQLASFFAMFEYKGDYNLSIHTTGDVRVQCTIDGITSEPQHQIRYTSLDGNIITPYNTNAFGANIVSNTYTNGQGLMLFDAPVTSIGNAAFYSCNTLTSIQIPNTVLAIQLDAFTGCNQLTELNIPTKVMSIDRNFISTQYLTVITVDPENQTYDSRNNCNAIIETASNRLLKGCQNTIIPNTVQIIGNSAFANCTALTQIVIPDGVSTIEYGAFNGCSAVETIRSLAAIPPTLESNAFGSISPTVPVYVPCSSLDMYQAEEHWGSIFSNIQCSSVTICYGESYTWHINGKTYTESGTYTHTTNYGEETLYLTVLPEVPVTEIIERICYGTTYQIGGQEYAATGNYTITLQDQNGCDSIINLQLTILSDVITEEKSEVISSNDIPYYWRGNAYSTTGRYTEVEQYDGTDCDSVIYILDLLVLTTGNYEEQYDTICQSQLPYTWYEQEIHSAGKYSYTEQYVGSAIDSIQHILNLTVIATDYSEEYQTVCYGETYTWNGQTYNTPGSYTATLSNIRGCDSIATLHLTVLPEIPTTEEYATICYGETFMWNGITCKYTDTYSAVLASVVTGCDSTAILHLTVLPQSTTETQKVNISVNELPYYWREKWYNESGNYYDTVSYSQFACDSAIYVLTLTVNTTNMCGDNLIWEYANGVLNIKGSGAMYDNPDLLSYRQQPWYPERVNHIVLPDGITHIGNVAFADCANLTSISLPSSLTSLGDGAFSWTGLQSVTIPASVTTMGEQVFETCNDLRTILYEGNPTIINNQTVHPFIGCVHLDTIITPAALWHCTSADQALEARYGVPHKARYIEVTDGELTKQAMSYIAQNSSALEVLDLTAATNTTLPLGALINSYRLSYLYLPEQIQTVPEMLAEGCYSLMEIIIPATVTEIGNYAFAGCSNVWHMTVDAVVPPTVYAETFKGIDRTITVAVPTGSEEAYRQANYWSEFFIEDTNSPLPITNCQKILREDQILILRNGQTYTMMGQPVNL